MSRRLVPLELAAVLAASWAVFTTVPISLGSLFAVASLAACYSLLELFDVELPRGDASSVSSPFIALTVMVLEPAGAILAIAPAAALINMLRRRDVDWLSRVHLSAERMLLLLGGVLMWHLAGGLTDWQLLLAAVSLSLATVSADFFLAQMRSAARQDIPMFGLLVGGARFQGTLIAAQVSAAIFGYMIYEDMHVWGALVITMLLMVMRQAFSLFVSVRRAYQSTIEALARTVEAQDPGKLGHAERVSSLATEVGRLVGLGSSDLERLSYAALLHDLGEVGSDHERNGDAGASVSLSAAQMIEHVSFLERVVGVVRLIEAPEEWMADADEEELMLAYICLVASRTDDLAMGRGTDSDASNIAFIHPRVSDEFKAETEMAFRTATRTVSGRLFAVAEPPGGSQ